MENVWKTCYEQKSIGSLMGVLNERHSPLMHLIEKFVKKNIAHMFNQNTKLKLKSEMREDDEAILSNEGEGNFFSAFRVLNIVKGRGYFNSPILIFFSVFKSWFYHEILNLAKKIEICETDEDIKFLLSKNFLSLWRNKDKNDPETIYSSKDAYVEYDRYLRKDQEILKDLRYIIELLHEMFIENKPEKLCRLLGPNWRGVKNGMRIEEYVIEISKKQILTQRFLLYLELIDDILFEKEINLNYQFKLFFSLQGILITLNTFMQLAEDYGNVNLYNILNEKFVSEFTSLERDQEYLHFIIQQLKNFFEFDDMMKEETRTTANSFLTIYCSIFNVELVYYLFPVMSEKNGVWKQRLRRKKIFPAFEIMNRCKANVVKSAITKVSVYFRLDEGFLYHLYSDEEILNFNLHIQLMNCYNILSFPVSLQQNIANLTVLELLESNINTLLTIQDADLNANEHVMEANCLSVYNNLEIYQGSVQTFCSSLIPFYFPQESESSQKVNLIFEEFQEYDKENAAKILWLNQAAMDVDEGQIFNEFFQEGNEENNPHENNLDDEKEVFRDTTIKNTKLMCGGTMIKKKFPQQNNQITFKNKNELVNTKQLMRQGYNQQNIYRNALNNQAMQVKQSIGSVGSVGSNTNESSSGYSMYPSSQNSQHKSVSENNLVRQNHSGMQKFSGNESTLSIKTGKHPSDNNVGFHPNFNNSKIFNANNNNLKTNINNSSVRNALINNVQYANSNMPINNNILINTRPNQNQNNQQQTTLKFGQNTNLGTNNVRQMPNMKENSGETTVKNLVLNSNSGGLFNSNQSQNNFSKMTPNFANHSIMKNVLGTNSSNISGLNQTNTSIKNSIPINNNFGGNTGIKFGGQMNNPVKNSIQMNNPNFGQQKNKPNFGNVNQTIQVNQNAGNQNFFQNPNTNLRINQNNNLQQQGGNLLNNNRSILNNNNLNNNFGVNNSSINMNNNFGFSNNSIMKKPNFNKKN